MKRIILLLIVLLIGLGWSATKVDKIIKKVQRKYKDVQTLYVDFKQINRFKLTGIENEIYGTLWLGQNDKFRLETEDQVMVSDGEAFWRYNKLENQVIVDYAKKSDQDILMKDFLFNIADRYYSEILSESKEGKDKIYLVKLTPKNQEDSFFKYIKVWIVDKKWTFKRVVYIDYDDNESEYEINKIQINPEVNNQVFRLQIPEGVEVVDLRF